MVLIPILAKKMFDDGDKNGKGEVVKCKKCEKYFMHTKKDTKCPFPSCGTEYGEVKEKDSASDEKENGENEATGTSKKTSKRTRRRGR